MGGRAQRFLPPGGSRSPPVRPSQDPPLLISTGALPFGRPPFSGESPPHSVPFLRRPTRTQAAPCHPGPRPPSGSPPPFSLRQGPLPVPRPPALAAPAAPELSGVPPLTPKLSWLFPSHPALGLVTPGHPPLSGTPVASDSSESYPSHSRRQSVPQTRAAGRPKGPPGLTRLSPAPAYLPSANSRNRAILPPAQSGRTRLRPGPGPDPARSPGPLPPASASGTLSWSFRPTTASKREAHVTALTCRCPRPTPALLPLPRPPVATKRHHLPHDNRPTLYQTSDLSIGPWGGGSFL